MNPVDQAILSRRSVRRFLPTPIPATDIEAILDIAAEPPAARTCSHGEATPWPDQPRTPWSTPSSPCSTPVNPAIITRSAYYPDEFFEPYLYVAAVGWDLYGKLGIAKGEAAKMKAQHRRNFQFFDAPVVESQVRLERYHQTAVLQLMRLHAALGPGGCSRPCVNGEKCTIVCPGKTGNFRLVRATPFTSRKLSVKKATRGGVIAQAPDFWGRHNERSDGRCGVGSAPGL